MKSTFLERLKKMLKLKFVSNEDVCKEENKRRYCCYCEYPGRPIGYLQTVVFATTIEGAKNGMLEELKAMRDEIDDLIKREEEHFFVIRYHTPGRCGVFRYLIKAHDLSAAKEIWKAYSKTDKNIEYEYEVANRGCSGFVGWQQVQESDFVLSELKQRTENIYELEFENWGSRSSHLDD